MGESPAPEYDEGWTGSPPPEHASHESPSGSDDSFSKDDSPQRHGFSDDGGGGGADLAGGNFKVVIRVRPPLPRELVAFQNAAKVEGDNNIVLSENLAALDDSGVAGPYASHSFTFDHVYDQGSDQKKVRAGNCERMYSFCCRRGYCIYLTPIPFSCAHRCMRQQRRPLLSRL